MSDGVKKLLVLFHVITVLNFLDVLTCKRHSEIFMGEMIKHLECFLKRCLREE